MSTRDIASDLVPTAVMITEIINSNTTTYSSSIDMAHYDSGFMFFVRNSRTDGTYVLSLQDSPDNSVWTDVSSAKLIQPDGAISITAAPSLGDDLKRLGAFSTNRYVRLAVTSTSVTVGATFEAFCIKFPEDRPEAVS